MAKLFWSAAFPKGNLESMDRQKILIVEDDSAIRQGIVDALTFAGYDTLEAGDGVAGMDMAIRVDCDLILLDLVLPGHEGLEIVAAVRDTRPTLPVIILTARGEEDDRVRGLTVGADDYMVKPFSVKELLARIEAVMRRTAERPTDVRTVAFPGGEADLEKCEVRYEGGGSCTLTEREAHLLRYLARHAGRPVSRDEILSRVWRLNPKGIAETRTIDVHVASLRAKLRDDQPPQKVIVTVRGKGYMFAGEEAVP